MSSYGTYNDIKLCYGIWKIIIENVPESERYVFKRVNKSFHQINKFLICDDKLFNLAKENRVESIIYYEGNEDKRLGFYGACMGGHLQILKYFLKKCNINHLSMKKAFNLSTFSFNAKVFEYLMSNSCGISMKSIKLSLYNGVCKYGKLSLVRIFFYNPEDDYDIDDYHENIVDAVMGGHWDVVDFLISHDVKNRYDFVFDGIFSSGNFDKLEWIFEKGISDINIGLYGACQTANIEMIKKLWSYGAKGIHINLLPRCGDINLMMNCIKEFNLSLSDFNEEALMNAIESKNITMIDFVISCLNELSMNKFLLYMPELLEDLCVNADIDILHFLMRKFNIDRCYFCDNIYHDLHSKIL